MRSKPFRFHHYISAFIRFFPLTTRTALTFVLAPLPNALFSHCGGDDFSTDEGSSPVDLGRFITAFIVVTGFSLPLVLAHSEIIKSGASIMSLIGGGYVRVAIQLPPLTTSAFASRAALYMGRF